MCGVRHIRTASPFYLFFFFNDTATTEIYTLSLHDALPISPQRDRPCDRRRHRGTHERDPGRLDRRSEEHTSELQSRLHLVCRLLLEKKNQAPAAQNDSIITPERLRHAIEQRQ